MACISRRASTSVIFPAVARALSASRRQWSASYVGCTTSPHLPPPSRERQIFRSVPIRNFNNGYGIFHADPRARTWNWRLLTNWRARTSSAKFIAIRNGARPQDARAMRKMRLGSTLPHRERERDPDTDRRQAAHDQCEPGNLANLGRDRSPHRCTPASPVPMNWDWGRWVP